MFEWRISKYDPRNRDVDGRYGAEDWTSIHDIGKSAGPRVLTANEYLRVEDAYLRAVLRFHAEAGSPLLHAVDVGAAGEAAAIPGDTVSFLTEGQIVRRDDLLPVVRSCLREIMWCRLEAADRSFMVHFGYDYYVYVCSLEPTPDAQRGAEEDGLFVEAFASPYRMSDRESAEERR